MKEIILSSNNDWAGFFLRLSAAVVLFPHGAQKMLGWFGGYGFTNSMNYFTNTVHLPWIIGLLVILLEFFGPLLLLAGIGTRVWAALLAILFTGIVLKDHMHNGFFMNWFGNQKGEGMEYSLLYIGICIALVVNGSGKLSIDNLINYTK